MLMKQAGNIDDFLYLSTWCENELQTSNLKEKYVCIVLYLINYSIYLLNLTESSSYTVIMIIWEGSRQSKFVIKVSNS